MKFKGVLAFDTIEELQKQYETGEFPYFFYMHMRNTKPWLICDGEVLINTAQRCTPTMYEIRNSAIAMTHDAVIAKVICHAMHIYQLLAREQIKRGVAEGKHVIN